MKRFPTPTELWSAAAPVTAAAAPDPSTLPAEVRRHLEFTGAAAAPPAAAVWLRMHGEIRLKGWYPFHAEQVIHAGRGMVWHAAVRMRGISIRGFDGIIDGAGAMRWKLFGLIPFLRAAGPDIDRSAAGRLGAEYMWLPGMLDRVDVAWNVPAPDRLRATYTVFTERITIDLDLAADGGARSFRLPRWGNPDGGAFAYADFGGHIDQYTTFGPFTIPTRLRLGWYFPGDRFDREGEFFRVTVDTARFR